MVPIYVERQKKKKAFRELVKPMLRSTMPAPQKKDIRTSASAASSTSVTLSTPLKHTHNHTPPVPVDADFSDEEMSRLGATLPMSLQPYTPTTLTEPGTSAMTQLPVSRDPVGYERIAVVSQGFPRP